ncbi:MAG: biotin--[acetyl-CoA-carboxylase] ligase [Nocardiopsaceae bacterium]|nr:biotin--[acetyl-CoA-carboxylase] ligase [Nocardiopsaceae bacterium]
MVAADGVGGAGALDAARLTAALSGAPRAAGEPGTMWTDVRIVAATGSTNTDVLRLAAAGAGEGLVLAAESQTAGKGRQGRVWQTKPGAALTFSALLRPEPVPQAAWGWLPLLTGVAVVHALGQVSRLDASLKWPNDVLVGQRKLAGILAEQTAGAVIIGTGINVLGSDQDLPVTSATSLERSGAGGTDRTSLLAAILEELEHWYQRWRETGHGDAETAGLRKEYLSLSATIGQHVRVQLPGDRVLTGLASGVDGAGRLLVEAGPDTDVAGLAVAGARGSGSDPAAAGQVAVSAGDVIHVRPAD